MFSRSVFLSLYLYRTKYPHNSTVHPSSAVVTMTSLDFHSLLKQQKALRRAELAEKTVQRKSVDVVQSRDQTKPPTSAAVSARSNDDPVGSKELVASGLCSGQEEGRILPFEELALQAEVDMEKVSYCYELEISFNFVVIPPGTEMRSSNSNCL